MIVSDVELWLGGPLPTGYRDFLARNVGEVRDDGLLLYSCDDLIERNTTFEVREYAPDHLAVGDDSGGRLIVIRPADADAAPGLIDSGAVGSLAPTSLADLWAAWQQAGFPLPDE